MKAKIILMAVALMMVTAANGENKKVTANIKQQCLPMALKWNVPIP